MDQVGVYHCISRCVRRAFLCGLDEYSGIDYEHRRSWIADRLKELSCIFGMEVFAYAVMSNHLHLVIRNRPDLAKSWTAEEVALRWCSLFPKRNAHGIAEVPGEEAIKSFVGDSARVEICRERLGDISWFMRCLNEPIARRANREDKCTGRFWEGRFKCQRLMDEGAMLACMAYVDLNYYLSLVEWTGQTIRDDKPGYIPVHLKPVLERFDLDTENWATNVESYGGLFYRVAGQLESILVRAQQKGQHWLRGRSGSEQLYRTRKKAA
jgi:hypothetical protein